MTLAQRGAEVHPCVGKIGPISDRGLIRGQLPRRSAQEKHAEALQSHESGGVQPNVPESLRTSRRRTLHSTYD